MSVTEKEIVDHQYIPDKNRSAFGLGWEYSRRGIGIGENPFIEEWKRKEFEAGYKAKERSKRGQ